MPTCWGQFYEHKFYMHCALSTNIIQRKNHVIYRIVWRTLTMMSLSHGLFSKTKNQNLGNGVQGVILSSFNDSRAAQG